MPLPAWLKHAFAVPKGPVEPTAEQAAMVERLAKEVVRRGMTTPALAFLEMTQPLNFVAAQALYFFQPILSTLFDPAKQQAFAEFLEQRGSIDFVCRVIERLADPSKAGDPADSSCGASADGDRPPQSG